MRADGAIGKCKRADHLLLFHGNQTNRQAASSRALFQIGCRIATNAVPVRPFALVGRGKAGEQLGMIGEQSNTNTHISEKIAKIAAPAAMRYQPKGLSP